MLQTYFNCWLELKPCIGKYEQKSLVLKNFNWFQTDTVPTFGFCNKYEFMSETLLHLARPKTTNFTHGEPGYPKPTTLQKKLLVKFVEISQQFEAKKKDIIC